MLFINRSYWPDTEATGQLLTDLCEDLSSDFRVSVLAGLPNHVAEGQPSVSPGRGTHNGVEILRVRHTRLGKHSFLGRITNFITFTIAALLRCLWLPHRPDLVVTETDPFFLPGVGLFLKFWSRCRFVAYLQDLYPDVAVAVGKVREGWITRCLRWCLVAAYRRADAVIVLGEDMRQRCIANGVPAEKIHVLPNWVDTSLIQPPQGENRFRKEQQLEGKFVVMYSGNMGVGHLLEPLLQAARELRSHAEIEFVFIGEGQQKAELQRIAAAEQLTNIRFLPYQPREFLAQSLSAANLQVVSMRPEVVGCLMPSKLYGVLAAGVPALVLAPADCELSRIVREQELGIVCSTDEATPLTARLVASILELSQHPERQRQAGENARRLAVAEYDRRIVTARFGDLLKSLIAAR